jgi:hypothetical protein
MSCAIIFWGITRSLSFTIDTINKKILDILRKNNINYDIFMHTYLIDYEYNNPRADEKNVKLNEKEYELLNCKSVIVENQKQVLELLNIDEYLTHGVTPSWKYKTTFENYILAMYSKMKSHELCLSSGIKYEWVIFMRPDVSYLSDFPIKKMFELQDNQICVPSFHLYFNINDRFAVVKYNKSSVYANTFKNLKQDSKYFLLHSESYLYTTLCIKESMEILYLQNFTFKRIRADGSMCKTDILLNDNLDYNYITNNYIIKKNTFVFQIILKESQNNNSSYFFSKIRTDLNVDMYIFTDDKTIEEKCKNYYVQYIYIEELGKWSNLKFYELVLDPLFFVSQKNYLYSVLFNKVNKNSENYLNIAVNAIQNNKRFKYIIKSTKNAIDNYNFENIELLIKNYTNMSDTNFNDTLLI